MRHKEQIMLAIFKWLFMAVFAVLAWLLTGYTYEYFHPYSPVKKKI